MQMDIKMAQVESEITKKFDGLEKKCSRQIFSRLSRNDFEMSISTFRSEIRDLFSRIQFCQNFSNFLKGKLEEIDPSFKYEAPEEVRNEYKEKKIKNLKPI